jgi:phytoene dehydrogenase-like protein
MPNLIDELTELSGYVGNFKYTKLETLAHYFFEDGTTVIAKNTPEELAKELKLKFNEDEDAVVKHLKTSKFYFDTTADLFLNQSLHKLKNFFNVKTLKAVLNS